MADSPLIHARSLVKQFGSFYAVDDVDLHVSAGEVVGFLGPNGAGKTTTMRMVTGFLKATAGTVQLAGIDLATDPREAKRHVGYLPEGAPAYPDMRVDEFLRFVARARGIRGAAARAAVDRASDLLELGKVRRQTIETLSKGFKRRVGFAQALLHDPSILILDEPTDGLDPNQKHDVRQLIRRMGEEGRKAIVLSTHILEEVEAVCTRAVIIRRGKTVFDGTPEQLDGRAPANVTRNRLDHVFRELTQDQAPQAGSKKDKEVAV